MTFKLYSAETWGLVGDVQRFRQHISLILKLLNIILIFYHYILQICLPIFVRN
jgi:hypothetical protein